MKDVACRKGKMIDKNVLRADDPVHKGDAAPQRDPGEGEHGNSDAFTKSVQLGEILGGVRFPCAAPTADQLTAHQSGK